MKYSKEIEGFLNFLKETEQNYNISRSTEQEMDAATQDLLHRIELGNDGYHDVAKLSKGLRTVRQKRRVAKDTATITEPIKLWIEQNHRSLDSLKRLLGEVRKAEKSTEKRSYAAKTSILRETLGHNYDNDLRRVSDK